MSIVNSGTLPVVSTLSNGLKVATIKVSSDLTSLGFWVNSGSFYETPENNGVAHYLEHILFRGNEKYPEARLNEVADKNGINLKAATSRVTTAFYAQAETHKVPLAMDMISSIVMNPDFKDSTVENERTTILMEEKEVALSFTEVVWDYLQMASFPNSPLGYPILGPRKNIKTITTKQIRDHYSRFFNPSNMVFGCATSLEHEEICELLEKSTSFLKKTQPIDIRSIQSKIQCNFEPRRRDYSTKLVDTTHISVGFEAVPFSSPDYIKFLMLKNALGDVVPSEPFSHSPLLRSTHIKKLSMQLLSYINTGIFAFLGVCKPGDEANYILSVIQSIRDTTLNGDSETLRIAKNRTKLGIGKVLTSSIMCADELATELLTSGYYRTPDEWNSIIDKVTVEDMKQMFLQHFDKRPVSAILISPESTKK